MLNLAFWRSNELIKFFYLFVRYLWFWINGLSASGGFVRIRYRGKYASILHPPECNPSKDRFYLRTGCQAYHGRASSKGGRPNASVRWQGARLRSGNHERIVFKGWGPYPSSIPVHIRSDRSNHTRPGLPERPENGQSHPADHGTRHFQMDPLPCPSVRISTRQSATIFPCGTNRAIK